MRGVMGFGHSVENPGEKAWLQNIRAEKNETISDKIQQSTTDSSGEILLVLSSSPEFVDNWRSREVQEGGVGEGSGGNWFSRVSQRNKNTIRR
jgi:hypothetical protein